MADLFSKLVNKAVDNANKTAKFAVENPTEPLVKEETDEEFLKRYKRERAMDRAKNSNPNNTLVADQKAYNRAKVENKVRDSLHLSKDNDLSWVKSRQEMIDEKKAEPDMEVGSRWVANKEKDDAEKQRENQAIADYVNNTLANLTASDPATSMMSDESRNRYSSSMQDFYNLDKDEEENKKKRDRKYIYEDGVGFLDAAAAREETSKPHEEAWNDRLDDNEDMVDYGKGNYVQTDDLGRVKFGGSFNEYGDWADAPGAAERAKEDVELMDRIAPYVKHAEAQIMNTRKNLSKSTGKYHFKTSDGTEVDFDKFLDSDFDTYYDRFLEEMQNGDVPIVYEKPENPKNSVAYSGGKWVSPVYDENGEPIPDAYVEVGDISKDNFDISTGVPLPKGDYERETGKYVLDNGQEVQIFLNGETGEEFINVFPQFEELKPGENEDTDAVAWAAYEPMYMEGNEPVALRDVREIMDGTAKKEQGFTIFGKENPGMNVKAPFWEEDSLWNPTNLGPAAADAVLSTLPYMSKGFGALNLASNLWLANKGLDPQTYDPDTRTFADPGTMNTAEASGLVGKTAAEYGLDYLLGMGAVAGAPMKMMRKAKAAVNSARKGTTFAHEMGELAEKELNKTTMQRIRGAANREGLQEAASSSFSTIDRGDPSLYWASPLMQNTYDEEGNIIRDSEGNPVMKMARDSEGRIMYDPNTPLPNRFINASEELVPSYVLGSIAGTGLGVPQAVEGQINDRAMTQIDQGKFYDDLRTAGVDIEDIRKRYKNLFKSMFDSAETNE